MLAEWAARLTPPGLPEWVGLALLLVLALLALCLLVMPFSVFGVKSRLDAIEAQLDELRAEIRGLAVRVSSDGRAARDWGAEAEPPPVLAPEPPRAGARAEPRITWPRAGGR